MIKKLAQKSIKTKPRTKTKSPSDAITLSVNAQNPLFSSKVETEQKILTAARNEFIANGLAGARMSEIAKTAGVNQALLHYYFRSKDQLYQRALKDIFQIVWSRMRKEIPTEPNPDDFESTVSTFVTTYLRTLNANPHFPMFLFREVASGGKHLEPVIHEIFTEFREIPNSIISGLKNGIKAGKIRPIDPLQFFLNLGGMCVFTFLAMPMIRKFMVGEEWKIEMNDEFIEARITAITSMVFDGLKVKRKA